MTKCSVCKQKFEYGEMYEYRGAISCEGCFDKLQQIRDHERSEIISEENHKTEKFRGLDMSDSRIGKANRQILKSDIEIAKKESSRIQNYERE